MDRRQRALDEFAIPAIPPHQGWLPIANERIQANGKVYNRGSVVPIEMLRPNLQAILRRIRWVPPDAVCAVPEVAAPVSEPEKPKPKYETVHVKDDPIATVRATRARLMDLGMNFADANSMIERNDSDLWKRALYARSEQYSKAEGLVGRRIWQPI